MTPNKWDLNLVKIVLLFCSGIVFGGHIELYATNNISLTGALLGTISMLLLAGFIVISSRIKDTKE